MTATATEALQAELNRLRTTLAPFDPETAEPRDHFQHAVLELIATTVHRILGDLDREEGVQDAPVVATLTTQVPPATERSEGTPQDSVEAPTSLHFALNGTLTTPAGIEGGEHDSPTSISLVVDRADEALYPVRLRLNVHTWDGQRAILNIPLTASVATELGRIVRQGGAR